MPTACCLQCRCGHHYVPSATWGRSLSEQCLSCPGSQLKVLAQIHCTFRGLGGFYRVCSSGGLETADQTGLNVEIATCSYLLAAGIKACTTAAGHSICISEVREMERKGLGSAWTVLQAGHIGPVQQQAPKCWSRLRLHFASITLQKCRLSPVTLTAIVTLFDPRVSRRLGGCPRSWN